MAQPDHRTVIAIDGPAAAGKSTVARELADTLGILLYDTGALYRAVTLACLRAGSDLDDEDAVLEIARSLTIRLTPASIEDGRLCDVSLNGEDVTWALRTPEIDASVSRVAAWPHVRQLLLETQRSAGDGEKVVMVGRDIGTVVTPHAGTKFYLDASAEERARRRYQDMLRLGQDMDYIAVLEDLRERDFRDSTRSTAPLRMAADAVYVLTDGRSIDDIVTQLYRTVTERWSTLS